MAHIALAPDQPGILALFAFRPETAAPLRELAETLLRGESSLTPAERELIAAYVSSKNECTFCTLSHAAACKSLYHDDAIVDSTVADPQSAPISDKLKALLVIAAKVGESGRAVRDADIARARAAGATDVEIHDAVLIAAAFCMFNRYVDGLATSAPASPAAYVEMGHVIAAQGYVRRG